MIRSSASSSVSRGPCTSSSSDGHPVVPRAVSGASAATSRPRRRDATALRHAGGVLRRPAWSASRVSSRAVGSGEIAIRSGLRSSSATGTSSQGARMARR
jgi:hypothetical protein